MTVVTAPSRLHFGLLHLPREGLSHWPGINGEPGLPVRSFGGVGMMIDNPGVRISVERSDEWDVAGPLSHRALEFARTFSDSLGLASRVAFKIRVLDCPEEHTGLGVGTSLALAVSKAIAVEMGHADWGSVELARRVGRGERSAVGVHGFQHGGLIVEAGKLPDESISPLVGQYPFPDEWRILLCRPKVTTSWSGIRERKAFRELADIETGQTDTLCRILLTALIPALQQRDLARFSESLFEFNYRVGRMFSPVQGGIFSHPEVEALVQRLRNAGIAGVGQSSWGPTVFGIVRESTEVATVQRLAGEQTAVQIVHASRGVICQLAEVR